MVRARGRGRGDDPFVARLVGEHRLARDVADRHALDHCLVAHVSAEPGHRRLLQAIGKAALFDFGMRLGEASAAALAVPLLKAAAACHNGMATFTQAGVSSKS